MRKGFGELRPPLESDLSCVSLMEVVQLKNNAQVDVCVTE